MRRAVAAIVTLGLGLGGFTSAASAGTIPRSISTSRQFIVYGPDARLRGAICDLAERTKASALRLLQEKDAWVTPIVVHARYPQANLPELPPAQLNFSQTGSGLKLQLDLSISADITAPAVERELLRSIYLEMMYRQHPDVEAGTAFVQPPDWLLEGTLALADQGDLSSLSACLRTATPGSFISLGEFLQLRPSLLDSPSRNIYRAYATALVAMLVAAPEDRMRLARFVAHLPQSSNDFFADLQAHFPMLGDNPEAADKRWRKAVAEFLSARFQILNCAETERQLARILRLTVWAGGQPVTEYSLEEFPRFIKLPKSPEILKGLTRDLLTLAANANPLYGPVIFEYQKIVAQLTRRKTWHAAQRLAAARAMREEISRTMEDIEDYMNWFEATQARTASGVFRNYFKAAELSLQPKPRRRDPISVYLDALEAQSGT